MINIQYTEVYLWTKKFSFSLFCYLHVSPNTWYAFFSLQFQEFSQTYDLGLVIGVAQCGDIENSSWLVLGSNMLPFSVFEELYMLHTLIQSIAQNSFATGFGMR